LFEENDSAETKEEEPMVKERRETEKSSIKREANSQIKLGRVEENSEACKASKTKINRIELIFSSSL
jgi:hypothetical protein